MAVLYHFNCLTHSKLISPSNLEVLQECRSLCRGIAELYACMMQSNLGVAQEYAQGVVRSLVGGAPGTSIYGYGNNNGNGELPQAPVPRSWRGLRGDDENCNVLPRQDLSSLLEKQHLSMIY